jgi:hypothetical protein
MLTADFDRTLQNAKARKRHRRLRISFYHRSNLLFPAEHARRHSHALALSTYWGVGQACPKDSISLFAIAIKRSHAILLSECARMSICPHRIQMTARVR